MLASRSNCHPIMRKSTINWISQEGDQLNLRHEIRYSLRDVRVSHVLRRNLAPLRVCRGLCEEFAHEFIPPSCKPFFIRKEGNFLFRWEVNFRMMTKILEER